ncbi:hypothetical protein F5Y16DRAFT_302346 [Xylariaceae sp. FL0255]|nr:hypothetical protein F5Y16DRAFT_302346 [Xylariaceae sp. FL0255]
MSVEIWPPIAPEQLKIEEDATQARELTWLLNTLQETLLSLKYGLEECYALLAPIDPGSTLVLSTPRAELVKGHVTRVGARLVKGTIHTRLRTMAPVTLSINPSHPLHLAPLATLNTLLTQAVDVARLCLAEGVAASTKRDADAAAFLSSQLRLLAQVMAEASGILKGSESKPTPMSSARPGSSSSMRGFLRPGTASGEHTTLPTPPPPPPPSSALVSGGDWTQSSASSTSFSPPLNPTVSFHVTIQDAALVLHLRALEPADAPVNLGIKFALAIGTARRLEHDEADKVFSYRHHDSPPISPTHPHAEDKGSQDATPIPSSSTFTTTTSTPYPTSGTRAMTGVNQGMGNGGNTAAVVGDVERVYVREKVRVESADPSLLSMSAKLGALSNTLGLARRNLAAVMGEEFDE